MIYIDDNNWVGSKTFTYDLQDAICDDLKTTIKPKSFDYMKSAFYQVTIRFNDLSAPDSNAVFEIIKHKTNLDKRWQAALLSEMQKDKRYHAKEVSTTAL